jgi:flagellar protein FlgJ
MTVIGPINGATTTPSSPGAQPDQLKAAAKQFEAIFLRQMIGAMRSASLSEDILSSGATEQFRDMADARTADAMAEKSAIGIADMLLKQFTPATRIGAVK